MQCKTPAQVGSKTENLKIEYVARRHNPSIHKNQWWTCIHYITKPPILSTQLNELCITLYAVMWKFFLQQKIPLCQKHLHHQKNCDSSLVLFIIKRVASQKKWNQFNWIEFRLQAKSLLSRAFVYVYFLDELNDNKKMPAYCLPFLYFGRYMT